MYRFFKPVLFLLSPEKAHGITMQFLILVRKIPGISFILRKLFFLEEERLEKNIFGLKFKNPVGLAAGFDKDAKYIEALTDLGFGFIEVGTVTPLAQDGNKKPRLFRLPKSESLINRMGFNNGGVEEMVERLKKIKHKQIIIGGNIGKNKITPIETAYTDYEKCFIALFPYVDYFVVNVSSPNTSDLRALQDKLPLNFLLNHIQSLNFELSGGKRNLKKLKPVLLKIAPDLNTSQLDDILEIVAENNLAGIVATNTTISREGLKESALEIKNMGAGGVSGKTLSEHSTDIIRYLRQNTRQKDLIIIGVGGISSGTDALEKIKAGADLIQIYTGLVYEGPGLVKAINKKLISDKILTSEHKSG